MVSQPSPVLKTKIVADASKYIDYARERGYDMYRLLKYYEVTITSHFLVKETKQGYGLDKGKKEDISKWTVSETADRKQ